MIKLAGYNLLTHNRMACFKHCPCKEYFQYELGIRRDREGMPMRFGGNAHDGLDGLAQGYSVQDVCGSKRKLYAKGPPWPASNEQLQDWLVEGEQVVRIIEGYEWRYRNDPVIVVASEQTFQLPLRNPRTGAASPVFQIAGKLDRIIDRDGRLLLQETKTTGISIEDPIGDYWLRTRLDQQVTLYYWAAREMGYDVDGIEWDAIHRPGIKPKKLSKADAKTYGIERETIAMYGSRLAADIKQRPDFYFARQLVPRIKADIDGFLEELWQVQKSIRVAQRYGYWYRNTSACLSLFRCEYLDVCHGAGDFSDSIPDGFKQVENIHPELEIDGATA